MSRPKMTQGDITAVIVIVSLWAAAMWATVAYALWSVGQCF